MPTEQDLEITKSIDEVWNEVEDEVEDEVKEDDVKKDEVSDDTDETEEVEEVNEEDGEGEGEAKEDSEETVEDETGDKEPEIDWASLGLEAFKGKTQKEVAEQIKAERRSLGHTTNMLGELRREVAQLKSQTTEKKVEEKPKSVLETIQDLDEADAAKYNAMYEKNPIKAMMTYGGDAIRQVVAEEVKKHVPEDLTSSLEQTKEEIEYNTFLASHPDITDVDIEQMKIFDDPQYLGKQGRSYEDLYGLSQLWRDRDERAEKIYGLMQKHAAMTFAEASTLVSPLTNITSPVDKDKIAKTVKKNKTTTSKSHPKKLAEVVPKGNTVDEVWDGFDD